MRRGPRVALWVLFLPCVLACTGPGCTTGSGALGCASGCVEGEQASQRTLVLPIGASAQPMLLKGSLHHDAGAITYAFRSAAGMHLDWSYAGPAVHVVLTYPNGETDGPLSPSTLLLPTTGLYVLSLHSNTMSDDADGPYTLMLRLLP